MAIDKPAGMTSRVVVNRVQKILRTESRQVRLGNIPNSTARTPSRRGRRLEKIGHTGTLDPMATGVLLVVIGQATKLIDSAHRLPKTYEAEFLLGVTSDTLDCTGSLHPLPEAAIPSREAFEEELPRWLGTIEQVPPKFSAVHVDGQRAYEKARRGENFELPKRTVTLHALRLIDYDYPKFSISARCSTGTYIRTLGADIAAALGTSAVMSRLVRTAIGPFELAHCLPLDAITDRTVIARELRSPLELIPDLPRVPVDEAASRLVRQGRWLTRSGLWPAIEVKERSQVAVVDHSGQLVAIAALSHDVLRPLRVFHAELGCPH